MIQYPDSFTHKLIAQKHYHTGIVTSTLAVLLMSTLIVGYSSFTSAQDPVQVCGNGAKEGVEQCDDGDLSNGDGCSSQCTIEKCGNSIVDEAIGEQCDGTPGCDIRCHLEYCGDGRLQSNEQCDDGNGVDDDGCSSVCTDETVITVTVEPHPSAPLPKPKPKPVPLPPVPLSDTALARSAITTLTTSLGSALFDLLPAGTKDELQELVRKLTLGRITTVERERGLFIVRSLLENLQQEREKTLNSIKALVDVSDAYFRELGIDTNKLRHDDPAVVLSELDRMASVRTPAEIRTAYVGTQRFLADIGVVIDPLKETALSDEMFQHLVDTVRMLNGQKTKDLDASLSRLRDTEDMKGAVRTLQAEHALDDTTVAELNGRLENIATSQTPNETVVAVRAFTKSLQSHDVMTPSDLLPETHTAPFIARLGDTVLTDKSPEEIAKLTEKVPVETSSFFRTGSLTDQVRAFRQFLRDDEHIRTLEAGLAPDRTAVFAVRFHDLDSALDRIDAGQSIGTCDTSMSAVLLCANQILSDLETEVRSTESVFDHTVHYLQDTFYRHP